MSRLTQAVNPAASERTWARHPAGFSVCPKWTWAPPSVQAQCEDMALVRLELAPLHPLDDVRERGVRGCGPADQATLPDDEPVEEPDRGAPALDHVLAHRWPVRAAAGFLRLGEAVLVELGFGARIAFARARDQLGIEVMNLLELIAERLADP